MANYKMTALLATALVSMAPLASAERDSRFTVVNLARADDTTMSVKTRSSSSFDADTFQGGVYKVGYDACQAQVKSATTPVSITLSGDKQSKRFLYSLESKTLSGQFEFDFSIFISLNEEQSLLT